MANFNIAYGKTVGFEGGYANDPDDFGKETYMGISRRYHPGWSGWQIIDYYKNVYKSNLEKFKARLTSDKELSNRVKLFYKTNYWDINILGEFNSQDIANELFDTGVNLGYNDAAAFLQLALNVLNKNNKLYDDLVVDGKIGPKTFAAMEACLEYRGDSYLYKVLNILQGHHYVNRMGDNSTQEKFAYGWLDRVEFK